MFLEWWMIAIFIIAAGLWANWLYSKGKVEGCVLGMEYQEKQNNRAKIDDFIDEIKLLPRELQAQTIAVYIFTAKLKDLGLLKFHSDGTMEGYNGKKVKVVETVEG